MSENKFLNWGSQTLNRFLNRIQHVYELECKNDYIIFTHLKELGISYAYTEYPTVILAIPVSSYAPKSQIFSYQITDVADI